MKQYIRNGAILSFLVFVLAGASLAADVSRNVPARLSFPLQTSLDISVHNISDDSLTDTLVFAYTGTETLVLASQYVRIEFASTFANWKIVTYTANLATTDTLHQYWGSLIGTDTNNHIPMQWKATTDSVSGGPQWDGTGTDFWMWYKDLGDSDYVQASADGYTTFVYGNGIASATLYSGVPEVTPTYLYVGAVTSSVNPDEYSTAIRFDLLHL